jgi:superoxide dismutase, Fe-Mn family
MDDFKTSYKLPDLPYSYSDLEPVISKQIMELHHDKHHRAYVNNLNQSLEKYHQAEKNKDTQAMIKLQSAVKFNGGGHINHSIFWSILAPISKGGGQGPTDGFLKIIEDDFGTFENFKEKLNAQTLSIEGSGWGWLGYNKLTRHLEIATTTNQNLLSMQNIVPLLCIDVWEHAYYLQYKNVKKDFVEALWKIFNWQEIEKKYSIACSK